MAKIDLFKLIKSHTVFYCPNCHTELRIAYISNPVLCCLKCNLTFELYFRKSKIPIEQVKKDGWLKN